MPALWTYPWDLADEGLEDAVVDAADRGIDTLAPATHYHSVQSMRPRLPEALFARYPGGCYFDPEPRHFDETPITPLPNDVAGLDDPLGAITTAAADHGLDVNAWTVVFHNSRLGAANPEYCTQDVFDTVHEHAFCPSYEAVQAYFEGIVAAIAEYPVAAIELESIGFPSAFHTHDTTFGHPKRQVLTTQTEEWLFSQCFCTACRERADGVDMDQAQAVIQSIIRDSFHTPHSDPLELAALVREYPSLEDLFTFRAEVIAELLERLADTTGAVALNAYLMDGFGVDPGDGWPAGVKLADVEAALDRATAICYVSDPGTARERLRRFTRQLDIPVDAGVTLDPDLIDRESQFHAVMDAVQTGATGDVSVYHHTIATEAQLDWIERAISG